MESIQTPLQMLMASAAAFLTMMGCGLGDTITDMFESGFDSESATTEAVPAPIDRGSPEAVAMQFVDDVAAGDYVGASTYLCAAAVAGFFAIDPADNVLLGADTSGLIPVVAVDGATGTLTFEGELILSPGTPDAFPIPGDLLPYTNVDMIELNGEWFLCPAELIE